MICLLKHPNFINIRYSRWRRLETAWCFLMCTLSIRRVTTVDNVTAPTMVPSTMPTNETLLKPDLDEVEIHTHTHLSKLCLNHTCPHAKKNVSFLTWVLIFIIRLRYIYIYIYIYVNSILGPYLTTIDFTN